MTRKPITMGAERQVAELVLQLGRAAYAECSASGPTQAQWIALRFFARANRFSRNVSGFADFHATTRGTASQTVKSLVEQGYLKGTRSEKDARRVRFDLTPRAREALAEDPLEGVVRAARKLSSTQLDRTASGLRQIMAVLAEDREGSLSGVCELCGHLDRCNGEKLRCRLMQESLEDHELQELCVRYQPRA